MDTNRFLKFVEESDGCWLWTGSLQARGYGYFYHEGGMRLAHRVAYEHYVGPIPGGLVIDHLCRNKRCVNPAHLEPVTNQENILRGNKPGPKPRTYCASGLHCIAETRNLRATGRSRGCRECENQRQRERRAENRQAGLK